MGRIVWDRLEDRNYEIGVDHGVLYVPDANGVFKGVPWNGLTEVKRANTRETEAVYFDGAKIHSYVKQTEFKGSLSAVTYPDEFDRLEGSHELKCGVFAEEQPPGIFGLCYRSLVGDFRGDESAYKLHVLYNLQATPSDKVYQTMGSSPKIMDFEWDLESIPEPIPNFRHTAEITIDSRKVDPWLLEDLEKILYGNPLNDPYLPPMAELVEFLDGWFRVRVTLQNPDAVLGDPDYGIFEIEEAPGREGFYIVENSGGAWVLRNANAIIYSGPVDFEGVEEDEAWASDPEAWEPVWYVLDDTPCGYDNATIKITDHGDGFWTAETEYDNVIVVNDDPEDELFGMFVIREATVLWSGPDSYRITDTLAT